MANRNSLKLTVLLPSLSKYSRRAWHWAVFKFTPIAERPDSNSAISRDLFLLASICLKTYPRPRIERDPLLARVSLISKTSWAPSYETVGGWATGSYAFGSMAVRIYQTLLSWGFFWARLITFLPTYSPYNYYPLCFSTTLLALTSSSCPNWFE